MNDPSVNGVNGAFHDLSERRVLVRINEDLAIQGYNVLQIFAFI